MENGFCLDNGLNHPVKLSDVDVEKIDWMTTTNGFQYISVLNVINAIGITNEEKRSLIETLCKAARDNNITLEPDVFDLMEQKFVFYGGSKETFGVIARMKKKNESMTLEMIYNTSPKALKELTNDFSEPLVRSLMMKAKTIGEQKGLLKYIKKVYAIWQKKTKILWSEHPAVGGYPEYFDTMEANIDSDRYITTSGSVPVGSIEYYQLMSQQKENQSSGLYSKDMLDAAVAAVKAQIPHFMYDQQNEGLSIVYGDNKKKVNLDEVIEKKTKDIVNKQLEEITATDADIDEIIADVYGQDLVDQVNKKMVEEEEQNDKDKEEDYDDEDDNVEAPKIFNSKLNEVEIIKKIKTLRSDQVTGMRRWYVFYRVFDFLEWLDKPTHAKFISWVEYHFGWKWNKRDFKAIQRELKKDPNEWCSVVITTKNGKKNKKIGPDYYNFAADIINTFVDIEDEGMHDKEDFLLPPYLATNHHNSW